MLGAFATLALGFLFAAPAANAQSALQTISNGTVTCKEYASAGGSQPYFPNTFWDCINTGSAPTSGERQVGSQARFLPTAIKTALAGVQVMIFQNAADFATFTGTAAPDSKYMAWTANSGPGALSGSKIAAVFAEAQLWSPNIVPTNQVATRNISGSYAINILQALGRLYDQQTVGNYSSVDPVFSTAVQYDAYWINPPEDTSSSVWGAAIAAAYPGQSAFEILGSLYGNTNADLFAFQFAADYGSNWSHLQQHLTLYHLNSTGAMTERVLGTAPLMHMADANGGVLCVRHATNYTSYPDWIWNCVHPYNPKATEQQFTLSANTDFHSNMKTELSSHDVNVFTMRSVDDWLNYFGYTLPPGKTKDGILGLSNEPDRVSAAFRHQYVGGVLNRAQNLEALYNGSINHELAHQLDDIWGDSAYNDPAFTAALTADKNAFNGTFNGDGCAVKIDAFLPVGSKVCANYNTTGKPSMSNWDILFDAHLLDTNNDEMFAYMFTNNTNGSQPLFYINIQNQMTNMQTYMTTLFSVGHP